MKKTFYPKLFFPLIQLLYVVFLLLSFILLQSFIFGDLFTNPNKHDRLFEAIIFELFIAYFTFHFIYYFCFYFKIVQIELNQFSTFELKSFKTFHANFHEISGYSTSKVSFGKYTWKSKSMIIYFKSGKVVEILSSFVSNVDLLENEFKIRKIKYLGFEDYNTGWFFRKYKFTEKTKRIN